MCFMQIKAKAKRLVVALLLLGVVLQVIKPATFRVEAADADDLRSQLAELEEQQEEIAEKIETLNVSQSDAQDKLDAVNELIENLNSQIDILDGSIEGLEDDIAVLDEQISDTAERIMQRYKMIYLLGNMDFAYLILLDIEDAKDFVMTWAYLDMLTEYDKKIISMYNDAKDEYAVKMAELTSQMAVYDSKMAELEEQQAEAAALIAEIEAEKQALEEEQRLIDKEMAEAREELDALIYEITMSSSDSEYVGGDFIWPLRNDKTITSYFGYRWGSLHAGVDVGTPVGTEVYSANAGTVVISGWSSGYGNYIIINHGGGYATVYGHLSERLVEVGDVVEQDELIALSGNTGRSTGPHLHFEIRINGTAVDPLDYVQIPRSSS